MEESLIDHFNEKGFVIAEKLLEVSEIKHYRKVLDEAV